MTDSSDTFSVTRDGDDRLVLAGELDLYAAELLNEAVAASAIDRIDLAAVSFVDSYGLRSLLEAQRAAAGRGVRLVLEAPSPEVTRLLEITCTTTQFEVVR
jgi:anti-sigma B factor antagonist